MRRCSPLSQRVANQRWTMQVLQMHPKAPAQNALGLLTSPLLAARRNLLGSTKYQGRYMAAIAPTCWRYWEVKHRPSWEECTHAERQLRKLRNIAKNKVYCSVVLNIYIVGRHYIWLLRASHQVSLVIGPVHSSTNSTSWGAYSPAAITALVTIQTYSQAVNVQPGTHSLLGRESGHTNQRARNNLISSGVELRNWLWAQNAWWLYWAHRNSLCTTYGIGWHFLSGTVVWGFFFLC